MTHERRAVPTVSIAIVNWNAGEYLRQCLASIAAASWISVVLREVVIVDNASTDGSTAALSESPVPVSIIGNAENRGFASACNQAARSVDADYLLFLNPDTRLEPDAVASAVAFLESPENTTVGIAGALLRDDSGKVARSCARSRGFLASTACCRPGASVIR
jgi:N-acetylglucosaminyl-diphospho-decaprenol L-rhamnosyltransferase